MRNPFDILGVKADATQKQIERAYNKEVKNAQRDIANESALDTKLSELSWALTELLDENSRGKYEVAEKTEITIREKENTIKTKNIVIKYILCIVLSSLLFGSQSILTTIIAILLLWFVDFLIKIMFATVNEAYMAHNVIRWVVVAVNGIVLLSNIVSFLSLSSFDGFKTIGYLMPSILLYVVLVIATFIFVKVSEKRMHKE